MEYRWKTNSGSLYPITGGSWTETGLATGLAWDGLNLPTSVPITQSVVAPFTSGYSVLMASARSMNYASGGQTISGIFSGCFVGAVTNVSNSFSQNVGAKLVIRAISTDASASIFATVFSGNIGFVNGSFVGHSFTGAYTPVSITGVFNLSCEIGYYSNLGGYTGVCTFQLGDSLPYPAYNGGSSGFAWLRDSNNFSGLPVLPSSGQWAQLPYSQWAY